MIAIPDFSSGAMENWGLITYRETALLFNEGVSAEANKQRVAVVVSHELAHQVRTLVRAGQVGTLILWMQMPSTAHPTLGSLVFALIINSFRMVARNSVSGH